MIQGGRPPTTPPKSQWRVALATASRWLGHSRDFKWLKEMRGNVAMSATVIATMTFQVGLNPPGGVVQTWGTAFTACPQDTANAGTGNFQGCPGQSVFGTAYYIHYRRWMLCNHISFFSSMFVCLWLISGLPLNHRFPVWLMATGMCVSFTGLSLTYLYGVDLILPFWDNEEFKPVNQCIEIISFVLVGMMVLFLLVRFLLLFDLTHPNVESSSNTNQAPPNTNASSDDEDY